MKKPLLLTLACSIVICLFSGCWKVTLDGPTFNSFVAINSECLVTNKNLDLKNKAIVDKLVKRLDTGSSITRIKARPIVDRSLIVHKWSSDLSSYIDSLKVELIAQTLDMRPQQADTLRLYELPATEYLDIPDHIMLGDAPAYGGKEGKGYDLKMKIAEFRKKIMLIVKSEDTVDLNIGLRTSNFIIQTSITGGEKESWEYYHFHNKPLIADIVILSQLQNDVKIAENAILNQEVLYAAAGELSLGNR